MAVESTLIVDQLLDQHLNTDRLIGDLATFVQTPSINPFDRTPKQGEGEEAFAAAYLRHMQEIGLEVGSHEVEPQRINVWGKIKGAGTGPTIMLAGHSDTVGVDGYDDPFSGHVSDGRLYGRGACDMKAALAAYLEVARVIKESETLLSGDIILAALCDEEHLMLGSNAFGRNGPQADFAIVGEPTKLAICPAHSGQQTFFIRTYGKATHSSRPENGINAIVQMARIVSAMEGYAEVLRRGPRHALCGHARCSPGIIRGGTISSSVPDFCELELDRRTLPGETTEQILEELRARIDPLNQEDPTLRYEIVGPKLNVSSLDTPMDSPVVQSLTTAYSHVLGNVPELVAFPGGTDAPQLGCPSVICGPGDIAQAHTINEYVETQQLSDSVRLYTHAIFHLMGEA